MLPKRFSQTVRQGFLQFTIDPGLITSAIENSVMLE